MRKHRVSQGATLIWVDPGVTTGLARITIDATWLAGVGEPGWKDLGEAVKHSWFAEIGRHPRLHENGKNVSGWSPAGKLQPLSGNTLPTPIWMLAEAEQAEFINETLDAWPEAAWGVEDFVPQSLNQTRDFLSPVRLISSVSTDEIRHGEGRVPFIQTPGKRWTASDDRLKMAGLYREGMGHATDAARHAAVFFRQARSEITLRQQAWPHLFGSVAA